MKLIATDYDGTLNYNGVGAETLEAIRRWRQAGNMFGVVSGRGPDFLSELMKVLGEDFDFLVLCNGSYATDSNGKLLFTSECNTIDVQEFVSDLLEWGAPIVYINYEDKCIRVVADKADMDYDYLLDEMPDISSFYKICTLFEDRGKIEPLAEKVEAKYGHQMNALRNGRCLDIAPFGIDKAEGIRRLCRVLGVSEQEVIAIGDELNDVAMLKAYTSYAMRHGNPLLAEFVNGMADSVAEVIRKEL